MDFYILRKGDELKAIPADKAICKDYEKSGYSYIDKVAACTEQAAINNIYFNETVPGKLLTNCGL